MSDVEKTPKYQAKTVAIDMEIEQKMKDAVQFFKLRAQKTGSIDGPVSMRDFISQAVLLRYEYLCKKHNDGKPFEHCVNLPRGRVRVKKG